MSNGIWVETYRPKNIDDIVLESSIKNSIKKWISDGEIPNILLSSKMPGTGKTSLAHVIINELGAEALFINASMENNIDTLRSKIQSFSSTSSWDGAPKIVVLDEVDGANERTFQPALRGFIEQFHANVRFVMTCNSLDKVIEPVRNRCINYNLDDMFHSNKELIKDIALRCMDVLQQEKITYNKEDLLFLIKHFFPSTRAIIMKLQTFSTTGELVVNRDEVDSDSNMQRIITNVLEKDFTEMRKNITQIHDSSVLFSEIYNSLDRFPAEKLPPIVICIAKYAANDGLVRDRMINTAACMCEIMSIL